MSTELKVNLRITIDPDKVPESLEIVLKILQAISETEEWKTIKNYEFSERTHPSFAIYGAIKYLKHLNDNYYEYLAEASGEEMHLSTD